MRSTLPRINSQRRKAKSPSFRSERWLCRIVGGSRHIALFHAANRLHQIKSSSLGWHLRALEARRIFDERLYFMGWHIPMTLPVARLLSLIAIGLCVSCSLAVETNTLNEGCPSDKKACDGQCVSTQLPQYGCANSNCVPCVMEHAKATCTGDGKCSVGACAPRFQHCPDVPDSNGCETNIYESVTHCGGCDPINDCNQQTVQNVLERKCGAGQCYISQCLDTYADCDGAFQNGCEVNLNTDSNHCGDCKVACVSPQACVLGVCQ